MMCKASGLSEGTLWCLSIKVRSDEMEEWADGQGNEIFIRFGNLVLLGTNCDV